MDTSFQKCFKSLQNPMCEYSFKHVSQSLHQVFKMPLPFETVDSVTLGFLQTRLLTELVDFS